MSARRQLARADRLTLRETVASVLVGMTIAGSVLASGWILGRVLKGRGK